MSELTPEVKAALEHWREWRRKFPEAHHGPADILADAFAALYPEEPPELEPGVFYRCKCMGNDAIIVSYKCGDVVSCKCGDRVGFSYITSDGEYGDEWDRVPSSIEDIRRIDDGGAKFREWATNNDILGFLRGDYGNSPGNYGSPGSDDAEKELAELLKETP